MLMAPGESPILKVDDGKGVFQDLGAEIHGGATNAPWSCVLADLNNDGYADVVFGRLPGLPQKSCGGYRMFSQYLPQPLAIGGQVLSASGGSGSVNLTFPAGCRVDGYEQCELDHVHRFHLGQRQWNAQLSGGAECGGGSLRHHYDCRFLLHCGARSAFDPRLKFHRLDAAHRGRRELDHNVHAGQQRCGLGAGATEFVRRSTTAERPLTLPLGFPQIRQRPCRCWQHRSTGHLLRMLR